MTAIQEPGGPVQKVSIAQLLGRLISTNAAKETRANLLADLAHAANSIALVYADADPAWNGWYRKQGNSGVGTWLQFEKLSSFAEAEVQQWVEYAQSGAQAAAATANFYDGGLLAAHAATVAGDYFACEFPAGIISYRRRTANGSAQIGTALTPAALAREMGVARARLLLTSDQPADGVPGDAWLSPTCIFYERRPRAQIMAGGVMVVAGGIAPVSEWARAESQPIATIHEALVNEGIL
ncbi:hypothetical protein ATE69_17335 [Sphingopyxis sp. H071]|nr:hypothetical protein ATE69_17335 [Sphingopyxis sp. H071]KTE71942.1 hypothetical protein ATE60_12520 [Sphingopyxis sp. H081]